MGRKEGPAGEPGLVCDEVEKRRGGISFGHGLGAFGTAATAPPSCRSRLCAVVCVVLLFCCVPK
jgi:hypothetical protein